MADPIIDTKKGGAETPKETVTPEIKTPVDGTTPDTTAQLEEVKAKADAAQVKAESLELAMQEERQKRQTLQEKLDALQNPKTPTKEDVLKEFDQEDVENVKKINKALGVLTEDEMNAREAVKTNRDTLGSFLNTHRDLFGEEGKATTEQNQNWAVYSRYLNDTFDITTQNVLGARNLQKKLDAALQNLTGKQSVEQIKAKAVDEAMAKASNAEKLAVGNGGGGTKGSDEWTRETPKDVAREGLLRAGWSEEEVDEMLSRK